MEAIEGFPIMQTKMTKCNSNSKNEMRISILVCYVQSLNISASNKHLRQFVKSDWFLPV